MLQIVAMGWNIIIMGIVAKQGMVSFQYYVQQITHQIARVDTM